MVTLPVPALAIASIGAWLKGALHLGIYRERVATLQATLPEDHGTWGLAFSPHGRYLAASSPHPQRSFKRTQPRSVRGLSGLRLRG